MPAREERTTPPGTPEPAALRPSLPAPQSPPPAPPAVATVPRVSAPGVVTEMGPMPAREERTTRPGSPKPEELPASVTAPPSPPLVPPLVPSGVETPSHVSLSSDVTEPRPLPEPEARTPPHESPQPQAPRSGAATPQSPQPVPPDVTTPPLASASSDLALDEETAPIRARLRAVARSVGEWEETHTLDLGMAARALTLVAEAHEEKLGLGLRSSKYSEAETMMRRARGIDDATWDQAKKAIGMQGLADVYDSAATVLVAGPLFAAASGPGAAELGLVGGLLIKYVGLWALTASSNAAGQILVDGYQDMAVRHHGLPNFLPELAAAPKMNTIYAQVNETFKACVPLLEKVAEELAKEVRDPELITECLQQLEPHLETMERLHAGYTKRVALGQSNFIKYETQVAFKLATAPAVAAAGVFGGPFALWGAAVAQQAVQGVFGYTDEILLKKHIFRSGMKYGDFRTEQAKAEGIHPLHSQWSAACVDPAKIKALWTNPIDVLKTNLSFIYTDALASGLRRVAKADKHLAARQPKVLRKEATAGGGGLAPGADRSQRPRNERELGEAAAKRDELLKDIGFFEAGVAAIKRGESAEALWDKLSPRGEIATALIDPKQHFALLARAKFRRPGEYTAQVLDRHGGLALPRSLAGMLADVLPLDVAHDSAEGQVHDTETHTHTGADGQDNDTDPLLGVDGQQSSHDPAGVPLKTVVGAALQQLGTLFGNALFNPIAKFTKQRYTRRMGLAQYERLEEQGPVRISLLKRNRRLVTGGIEPNYAVPVPGGEAINVDISQTRAYWRATHSGPSSVAVGTKDALKGFGSHMKAVGTLVPRGVRGNLASRKAKAIVARIQNINRAWNNQPREPLAPATPSPAASAAAQTAPGASGSNPGGAAAQEAPKAALQKKTRVHR
jgi:hypothetical protein